MIRQLQKGGGLSIVGCGWLSQESRRDHLLEQGAHKVNDQTNESGYRQVKLFEHWYLPRLPEPASVDT